ncbi:MAG: hypothetical protein R2856_19065 [Caldilineaceae bacterium]
MESLFPQTANNDYRGAPLAKWIFVFLTAVTLVRSLIHIFAADGGAQSIATIPLSDFTASGAAAVIGMFALWGCRNCCLVCSTWWCCGATRT